MGSEFLRDWWRRLYSAPRPHLRIVLYTRQGCHLCEDAWQLLEAARKRDGFTLDSVDVDGDPALAARFGENVPVVEVNGTVRMWGRINPVLLQRLFRGERKAQAP